MNENEILKIIKNGESNSVEFKSWIKCSGKKERISLATKEAVGLANTKGGVILFGVEDDGSVTGCTDYDIQNLMKAIYDKTTPSMFTEIESIKTSYGDVILIRVEKGTTTYATSAGEVFKRLGKDTMPFYPSDFSKHLSETKSDYSSKIIIESTENDIDKLEVYKLKEKIRVRDKESTLPDLEDISFLNNLGLIAEVDSKIKLTVAGVLFIGKESAIRTFLPQAEVIYLHYGDNNREEYDNRTDMKLPIIAVLDNITEKVRNNNRLINIQVGLFRIEVYDFSEKVFQEALLNAMSHRSYESNGAIYIKHYSDKIVVENPGGFPEGISEKNIITHPSNPRNKLIAETLQRLKYVQRSGQGVDIMFREMISMGKPYPEYRIYSDAVSLTIRSAIENEQFIKFVVNEQDTNGFMSLSELMILRYLSDNRTLNLSKAKDLTQLSENEVRHTLNRLIKKGLIQILGRVYMLTARVYEDIKSNVQYTQDKIIQYVKAKNMIIDYIKSKGSISNAVVQEMCGFSKDQAYYTLKKLKNEGNIIIVGKGSTAKYILSDNIPR